MNSILVVSQMPPNKRLHSDAALRASANEHSGSRWFLSQHWFETDRRAERVKRKR
jgi:hypothetical protein